jgi:hypothetical protein
MWASDFDLISISSSSVLTPHIPFVNPDLLNLSGGPLIEWALIDSILILVLDIRFDGTGAT